MGLLRSLGKIFKKVLSGLGSVLGLVPSGAEKRYRRSLLEEDRRAGEQQKKAEDALKRKKEQLMSMRRSMGAGRKSLLSSWYDEDNRQESTIGS
jgi:hypothetical protein